MAKMKALVCRECGKEYPTKAIHVCEMCFGPLEVKYNYAEVKQIISRKKIQEGPRSMWRYADLLPVEGTNYLGPHAGMTPLVRAKNLGAYLGIDELYIKNDTVNHPTLSFKDRVVAVALTRARELGFETVACASTGYTEIFFRSLSFHSNFTTPSTSANSVSFVAFRTFLPGWNFVPFCVTRMLPARTFSPPYFLMPRYCGLLVRPLRLEPTPFLCAMA